LANQSEGAKASGGDEAQFKGNKFLRTTHSRGNALNPTFSDFWHDAIDNDNSPHRFKGGLRYACFARDLDIAPLDQSIACPESTSYIELSCYYAGTHSRKPWNP
jgi:hypothetical protein